MRRLHLDFARQPSALRRAGWPLLVIGVLLSLQLARLYAESEVTLTQLEKQRQAQAANASAKPAPAHVTDEKQQKELALANQVLARLGMPWDLLLNEIESSMSPQVSLLSAEPDMDKSELTLTVEARTMADMVDYVKRLAGSPQFADVRMRSHQIQLLDPQKPVRFVVSARWLMAQPRSGAR